MTDDRGQHWAKTYKALLGDLVAALGGEAITPLRRATARSIAVLMTEQTMLQDRFANARGGSTEELSTFLKLSTEIGTLLRSVGLDKPLQLESASADSGAIAKLEAFLNAQIAVRQEEESAQIAARQEEESRGIYHDSSGKRITRDMIAEPEPEPPAANDHANLAQPGPELTSTEKFLQWSASGGGGSIGSGWDSMSPHPSWSRIKS